MAEGKEESIMESVLRAIGNTKSSTEFVFSDLELGISSIKTKITLNGKISVEVRPLHE